MRNAAAALHEHLECVHQESVGIRTFPLAIIGREMAADIAFAHGAKQRIDERGDVLTRRIGSDAVERGDLVQALATPSWLDPSLGGPRR